MKYTYGTKYQVVKEHSHIIELRLQIISMIAQYKALHKRKYYKSLAADITNCMLYPSRAVYWCFNEDEKRDLNLTQTGLFARYITAG